MLEVMFVEPWDENTEIRWQKESRKRLNKVINRFNKWQIEKAFDAEYGYKVLRHIQAEKQGIGSQDGGSGYLKELEKMECFVKKNLEAHCPCCGSTVW